MHKISQRTFQMNIMKETYTNSQKIAQYLVQVSKEDSVLLYFILESCDNLCFYSTKPHEKGQVSREIIIRTTVEFQNELQRLLEFFAQSRSLIFMDKSFHYD